ncbi:FAD-dependent oxidoreductase [Agrococcus sp. SGAir0287]|uniref:FAD-dependent oxidoreductase n=1 Tax=Agrococcus sp. SGAir0287 TaxID=2070347 RepID=UPI0010CCC690|nr:FAD-dependent oxidoreductase [Agrococcus sp. SGAir0287]QCR19517.1 mycothione reductase [Agrococcus sp. SGAir0287]
MIEVELAIVGSGSGNAVVGKEWKGRAVAIVDAAPWFGGTCLNVGCIPTKMLVHPADVVEAVRHGARIGVHGTATGDWHAVQERVFGRIDANAAASERWREGQEGVHVVREHVHLEDARTLVTASGERIRAERLVIAAGSRPRDIPGVDPALVHTSDTVMRVPILPRSAVIVGGGAIAVELAHVLSAFGVDLTLVLRGERVLSAEDEAVSALATRIAADRWTVLRGRTVTAVEAAGDGRRVTLDDGTVLDTGLVLNATGRIPNADALGASALFDTHDDGRLVTDARMRVLARGEPVEGVYALGDVTSEHQLKHVANHQARVVRDNLAGGAMEDVLAPVPQAIFGHPEVASFGVRGQDAPADAVVVDRAFGTTAYGWAMEDESSFARLVVGADGTILGAHVIGPSAAILIQPLVLAASEGRTVHGLARSLYWPHPALTEVIENALLDAEKALSR